MANSNKSKNKKTLDAFADDLDAMVKTEATPFAQQVGQIEDDDAIDRLLMGDNFQPVEEGNDRDEFADVDALIGDEIEDVGKAASEIDEFGEDIDDMIANIQNGKRQAEPVVGDIDEFADTDDDVELVKSIDEEMIPELMALDSVTEIDEFADESADDVVPTAVVPDIQPDEFEGMKEIDEFPEVSPDSGHHADFLMADFDISSGGDGFKSVEDEQAADEFADDAVEMPAAVAAAAAVSPAVAAMVDEFAEPEPVKAAPAAEKTPSQAEHGAELAALSSQITVLKKQQQVFKQEMTEKAGKDELIKCLEDIASLQGEQKKTKRAVDAVGSNKPIAAYIANGLAVTALLVGTGLGFQGYIAKSQVGELVPIIGKLQERLNATPAGNVPGNEMLQQQLNELKTASGLANNQIAEINKVLQGGQAPVKASGDLAKQLAELSSQNMQMGSAIEALQNKVSALEKGRAVAAAPAPKPEKKKPVAAAENWAVNLIAFKQDWYAKRKAEEFAGKGVPAKVIKSEAKGETWYRLFVDGFSSQYEAAGYAAKVKKNLNLDSVWVTRHKD